MSNGSLLALRRTQERTPEDRAWNRLLEEVAKRTVIAGRGLVACMTHGGTVMNLLGAGGSGPSIALTLETITGSLPLSVKVTAGRVVWMGLAVDLPESPDIPVTANTESFKVWLELGDPVPDEGSAPPTITVKGGADGWEGYPNQSPNFPVARYWLLAEVKSGATAIDTITKRWNGGDLPWSGPYSAYA